MLRFIRPAPRVHVRRVLVALVMLTLLPGFTLDAQDDAAAASNVPAAETVTAAEDAWSAAEATLATTSWSDVEIGGISRAVFELALRAARCAIRSGAVAFPGTLTVIDYSRPSTARRLWVFDLREQKLLFEELVAHGQGSGDNFATRFSNEPDTHRSSIGLFVTGTTYLGRNGYSLRLDGLEKGFNDRARERAIVMHGASYVSEQFAKLAGRIGRSWGCPALNDAVARRIIDTVRGGGLVFSYYPDQKWLTSSKFLRCGDARQTTVYSSDSGAS